MKRASISLSIETIVVLILAIVVMAFALPFIKDLFEKTKGGIIGQFPEVEIYATATDPIGIGNEFYIKPGQEKKMTLHVYNNINTDIKINKDTIKFENCVGSTNTPTVPAAEIVEKLEPGKATKIKIIFRGQTGMANNDICKIKIGEGSDDKYRIVQSFFLITQ